MLAINMPIAAIIIIPKLVGLEIADCVAVANDDTTITDIVSHVSVKFIIGLIKMNQIVIRNTDDPKYWLIRWLSNMCGLDLFIMFRVVLMIENATITESITETSYIVTYDNSRREKICGKMIIVVNTIPCTNNFGLRLSLFADFILL
jgi:hypothetical protein